MRLLTRHRTVGVSLASVAIAAGGMSFALGWLTPPASLQFVAPVQQASGVRLTPPVAVSSLEASGG